MSSIDVNIVLIGDNPDSNPPAIVLALLRLLFFDFPKIHQNRSYRICLRNIPIRTRVK
jgi:hypothetical protein